MDTLLDKPSQSGLRIRTILKTIVSIALIALAGWNIEAFTTTVMRLPSRDVNNVVNSEKYWTPVHKQLDIAGYSMGELGFVTPASLRGEPPSNLETLQQVELGFVVIPFHLVRNKLDTPFVLADFRRERPAELPPGLMPYFEPGNGLVLLKNTARQ